MAQPVEPQLGGKSFSCPHCGAFSHQLWNKIFIAAFDRNDTPTVLRFDPTVSERIAIAAAAGDEASKNLYEFVNRLKDNEVTYQFLPQGAVLRSLMNNLWLSRCYSCEGFSVWVKDRVVYPVRDTAIIAHEEMPNDVKADFDEAANIVGNSPRGAAALLRLCVQKLVVALGGKGDNINQDIGELVRKGAIDKRIQQALDLVRVIGNNAVHPGQIDLKDDKPTAMKLFNLVNVIVEAAISAPKHIQEMYETVMPESARQQVEKRDS